MKWTQGISLLLLTASVAWSQVAPRPNIILVVADDIGYGDLSCYGQTAFRTPYLDLMAAEGIQFMQAYSGCSVCGPSRCSLMTGKHAGHASIRSNTGGVPLKDGDVTMAEVLNNVGYATGGFGKWGLGDLDTEGAPEKQGFDRFYGYYHQIHAHNYYPDYLIDTGRKVSLPGNKDFHKNNPGEGGMPDMNGDKAAQFSHTLIKQEMFDWIRENKDNAFFCYAPWTLPHPKFELPESSPAWQAVKDQPWSKDAKGHAALTLMLDRDMGELFALLKELDLDQNTIVIFCSDNGPDQRYEDELNSAGSLRGKKGSLYEGGLRVPLIARWPGQIGPARKNNLMIYFPDLMPTLAQLAGTSERLPSDTDGLSFVPTLLNQPAYQLHHDYLYWEHTPVDWEAGGVLKTDETAQAIRKGFWKAVRSSPEAPLELYNLGLDPSEQTNVVEAEIEILKEFSKALETVRTPIPAQPEPKKPDGQSYR